MKDKLHHILNFKQLTPRLCTAGQPDADELHAIHSAGYEVVINLGLHDAPYALEDEAGVVTDLGMAYHHLEVDFQAPDMTTFYVFRDLLRELSERSCFIHCAANKRVSTFMALYRVIELDWSWPEAEAQMLEIWKPNPVWQDFIRKALAETATRKA